MDPRTQKILIETLKILGKAAFTSIAYGLVARVWRLQYELTKNNDIDISVLNKLEEEHRKEWEGWEKD